MSILSNVLIAMFMAPLGIAFWSWLASLPLRFAVVHPKALAASSVVVGFLACVTMIILKSNFWDTERLACLIALTVSAPVVFFWLLGRQQRNLETVHG